MLFAAGSLLAVGLAACGRGGSGDPVVPVVPITNYTMRVTGTATSGATTLSEWVNFALYVT